MMELTTEYLNHRKNEVRMQVLAAVYHIWGPSDEDMWFLPRETLILPVSMILEVLDARAYYKII